MSSLIPILKWEILSNTLVMHHSHYTGCAYAIAWVDDIEYYSVYPFFRDPLCRRADPLEFEVRINHVGTGKSELVGIVPGPLDNAYVLAREHVGDSE